MDLAELCLRRVGIGDSSERFRDGRCPASPSDGSSGWAFHFRVAAVVLTWVRLLEFPKRSLKWGVKKQTGSEPHEFVKKQLLKDKDGSWGTGVGDKGRAWHSPLLLLQHSECSYPAAEWEASTFLLSFLKWLRISSLTVMELQFKDAPCHCGLFILIYNIQFGSFSAFQHFACLILNCSLVVLRLGSWLKWCHIHLIELCWRWIFLSVLNLGHKSSRFYWPEHRLSPSLQGQIW